MPIETDVACTVCGCVCDDLRLHFEGDRVVQAEGACFLAEPWFIAQSHTPRAAAEVGGQPRALGQALDQAAELLAPARAPLVYGLSRSSTAGQRAAVRLAEYLGATIDTTASLCHGPSIMAVQEVGESTCTLGEVRHRADLVLFWGCNPAVTHPRHAERYSVFPPGQFVPHGRRDRTVVMIGDEREVFDWRLDPQGALPDVVVPVAPGRDFEALATLRALLQGLPLESDRPDVQVTGAPLEQLEALIERMKSCRCGAVFFGLGLTGTGQDSGAARHQLGHLNVELLLRLVAELNAHTRFYARRMRLYGDVTGADNVLCWQSGFPFGVNYARGYPRYNPGEYSAEDLLARREVDACVLIGTETVPLFHADAFRHLREIPTVVLDYPGTELPFDATLRITTSPYGLCSPGTVYRMDEVPIPLRAPLPARYPTDAEVLDAILARLRKVGPAA